MGVKSGKTFKGLYFIHLMKEIAKIFKKHSEDLTKTVRDVYSLKIINLGRF